MTARRAEPASPLLCPSGRCEVGAKLLGVVGPDGSVGYVSPPIPLTSDFVAAAHRGRDPERRFRFVQPCVESACANWNGRCEVIERANRQRLERIATDGWLPACGIRPSCRWFAQAGVEACLTCPLVVTELPEGLRADPATGAPA